MDFFKTKSCVLFLELLFGLMELAIFAVDIAYPVIILSCLNINYFDEYIYYIILLNILSLIMIPWYFTMIQSIVYIPRNLIFSVFTIYFPLRGYVDDLISIYCKVDSSWNDINDFIVAHCKQRPSILRRRIINDPLKSIKNNNIEIKIEELHTLQLKHLYVILEHEWYISSSFINLIYNICKRSILWIVMNGAVVEYYDKNGTLLCFQLFIKKGYSLTFYYHYSIKRAKKMNLLMYAVRIAVITAIEINKKQDFINKKIKYINLTLNAKSSCTKTKANCGFDTVDHRKQFNKSWDIYFGGTSIFSINTISNQHIFTI